MQELRLFNFQKISIRLYCGSHVGLQKNAHQPILPNNIIENSQTSLAYNSFFIGPNNFKSNAKTHCMVKIWSKLIILCIIMFLMTSYVRHQFEYHLYKFETWIFVMLFMFFPLKPDMKAKINPNLMQQSLATERLLHSFIIFSGWAVRK